MYVKSQRMYKIYYRGYRQWSVIGSDLEITSQVRSNTKVRIRRKSRILSL